MEPANQRLSKQRLVCFPLEQGVVKHHGVLVCDGEGRRAKPVRTFGLTLQANCLVPSQTVQQRLDNILSLCKNHRYEKHH